MATDELVDVLNLARALAAIVEELRRIRRLLEQLAATKG